MLNKITPSGTETQFKDRLFKAIFGRDNPQSKKWRLELYNALRGTNYTDPDALELNTIENVIYLTMRNDISFLVDSQMTLFEQQSTYNPNMPLRGLMYFAQLYQMYLSKIDRTLHENRLVKIPYPKFIVFYNGSKETEDIEYLRLSDAFENKEKCGDFEWTAEMINININHSKALQKKCKPLYDYVRYVARIKDNRKQGMTASDVVNEAVDWAIKENLLDGFFKIQKEEVLAMSLTEYDAEAVKRCFIREGREEGIAEGIIEGSRQKAIENAKVLLADGKYSAQQISELLNIPLELFVDNNKVS